MKYIVYIILMFGLFFVNNSSVQAQDVYSQTRALKILSVELPEFKLKDLPELKLPAKPQYTPGSNGERQYWLNKKDPAPYAGILLNREAMALILSEYEGLEERAKATIEAQRKSDLAVLNLEISKLNVELETKTKKCETKIEAREQEINRLLKVNKDLGKAAKDRKKKFLIGLSTTAAGIIAGFIAGAFLI